MTSQTHQRALYSHMLPGFFVRPLLQLLGNKTVHPSTFASSVDHSCAAVLVRTTPLTRCCHVAQRPLMVARSACTVFLSDGSRSRLLGFSSAGDDAVESLRP